MAKVFNSATGVLTTSEADIYVATGSKAMTLLIQVANTSSNTTACELWLTDGSNTHLFPVVPSQQIVPGDGVRDISKHVILTGYKIRGLASAGSAIYVEISAIEGMT
jgi:hypothetical protein